MPDVAYVGAVQSSGSSGDASLVVEYPPGVTSGDMVVVLTEADYTHVSTPAGWNQIVAPGQADAGSTMQVSALYRYTTGETSASLPIVATAGGGLAIVAICAAYRNVAGWDNLTAEKAIPNNGDTGTLRQKTFAAANRFPFLGHCAVGGGNADPVVSLSPGMTTRWDVNSSPQMGQHRWGIRDGGKASAQDVYSNYSWLQVFGGMVPTNAAPNTPTGLSSSIVQATGVATLNAQVTDPDFDTVAITYEWSTSSTFASGVSTTTTSQAAGGQNRPIATGALAINSVYYWRARGVDPSGAVSPWTATQSITTNRSPNAPSNVSPAAGTPTGATSVGVSATVSDPDGSNCYALFRWSTDPGFGTYTDVNGNTVTSGSTSSATLSGLPANATIYVRVYSNDGVSFSGFTTTNFLTDRSPTAPTALTVTTTRLNEPFTLTWTHNDPDNTAQAGVFLRRTNASGGVEFWNGAAWQGSSVYLAQSATSYAFPAGTFPPGSYTLAVSTRAGGLDSPYSAGLSVTSAGGLSMII